MSARLAQPPPSGDRAEVARRHDEAAAALAGADQRLRDLETALAMRRLEYGRALQWHDRMMRQLRDQARARSIDISPERLKEIERISERYEVARAALSAAQDAWERGSADHLGFTSRLRALHYARLLSALSAARPSDGAAAGLARAWVDYALGRPGARRPSVLETSAVLDAARGGRLAPVAPAAETMRVPARAPAPTTAERIRAIRAPYGPPAVIEAAPSTGSLWGPGTPPPWGFRLPSAGVQVTMLR